MFIIGPQIHNYHSITVVFVRFSGHREVKGPFGYQTHIHHLNPDVSGNRMPTVLLFSSYLVPVRLPLVNSVDLVESNNERDFLLFEHVERFDGLRLETMHDVDNEDGDIAETRTAISQIGKRFVTGSVDDQKAG